MPEGHDDGEDHGLILAAYRRIGKAAEAGKGVRLSAREVERIWDYDFAIRGAVEAANEGRTHNN